MADKIAMHRQIDYDLHGFVGIRLLNATSADEASVTRQLGPIQSPLHREPDIVIRFVDELPVSSPVRYLGQDDAGFTDDAFLILRGKNKTRARVQIPFDRVGRRCEIVCESRSTAVPLLIPIVNLTALNNGAIPLHASAFIYEGKGVLATGWAKGGKTESLLAFMSEGAVYVGDEWIYLSCDGTKMYGIPEPIRVWDWHLRYLPHYKALLSRSDRMKLRGLKKLTSLIDMAGTFSGIGLGILPKGPARRISVLLKQQMYLQLPPHQLFGPDSCRLAATPDTLFFIASHEPPHVSVQSIAPREISRRMIFSLQEERKNFLSYYLKFRFAFPGIKNELIEQVEAREAVALEHALAGKDSYAVFHPYPVQLSKLFEAMRPTIVQAGLKRLTGA